jgi:hypothetical protein
VEVDGEVLYEYPGPLPRMGSREYDAYERGVLSARCEACQAEHHGPSLIPKDAALMKYFEIGLFSSIACIECGKDLPSTDE